MGNDDRSLDLLGVKPVAQAVDKVVDASVAGLSAFLSRICLPVAEEFGLLLQDKVKAWRAANAKKILEKAKETYESQSNQEDRYVHPRLVAAVLEHGSWEEEDEVQSMWAGLLASACTSSGKDQSNLIFMNILKQMTSEEVRLFNFSCENSKIISSQAGWICVEHNLFATLPELQSTIQTDDIYKIDFLLDHCREMGLFHPHSGFNVNMGDRADITPSSLGLQLYVRAQGYVGSPLDYFGIAKPDLSPT